MGEVGAVGDIFRALGKSSLSPVPPGKVAYAEGNVVLTKHFVWRQAQTGLIREATQSVLLVSEVLGQTGSKLAEEVLEDVRYVLVEHFESEPETAMVDEDRPAVSWQVA
jgi:DNA/RNA-binding domain of Phe-tRNA-synthetase-like protein